MYIFVINLVSKRSLQGLVENFNGKRVFQGALLALVGLGTVLMVYLKSEFLAHTKFTSVADVELPMRQIGEALVGSEKYQYVLPFELISVFLLACIIGGIMIARKEDKKK